MSRNRIKRRLVLKRKPDFVFNEILARVASVNTDSVCGSPAGTCLMQVGRMDRTGSRVTADLAWDVRPSWTMQAEPGGQEFQIYQTASHKYWLRKLIRMCR